MDIIVHHVKYYYPYNVEQFIYDRSIKSIFSPLSRKMRVPLLFQSDRSNYCKTCSVCGIGNVDYKQIGDGSYAGAIQQGNAVIDLRCLFAQINNPGWRVCF